MDRPAAVEEGTVERREEWVSDTRRFAELRDPWNRLATDSLFLTWDWLDCWWQAFGQGAEMRVHVSWDRSQLVGGMAFGLRGRHLWAMADQQTDLYRPVTRSSQDLDPILRAVAEGPWSRITLPGVPTDDPATERLLDTLRARGWLVHEVFRESCPIIDTRGTFDAYSQGLSANARRQVSKARRRLERQGHVELRVVEPVDELEPVLAESFALEAAGWKGRSKSAILSSQRMAGFWRSLFERYQRLGGLRFSELRLDGALVAFCLGIVHNARLYTLKTSYDERYAYFAPGNVLRLEMIERCFEEEIDAQELLGPMLRWKQRYATGSRDTSVLRAYRRRPGSVIRYCGRRLVVPWLRAVYVRSRRAVDRLRGRRGASPAQGDEAGA
jgi:CelD/BcsL family acetyltransferase involved in cellulose biosynthesis